LKWIGQHIVDSIAKFRNTVDFSKDVTFYQPVNDANPSIRIGSSDDEYFELSVNYQGTTTQTAQIIQFGSRTESGTANDGRFNFSVDQTSILKIQDDGIDLYAGKGIGINGVDILTDNGSGVATLSNIDAIDATTISTLNAALTAGDITGVTAGGGLTGGGNSGTVTLGIDESTTSEINANTVKATNVTTNLTGTTHASQYRVNSSDGTDVVIAEASGSIAGVMTVAHHDKLDGIETSATADQSKSDIDGLAITTVGTVDTGVWEGTAIASSATKHLMHYDFIGYGTGDGTNYEVSKNMATNTAPFNHDTNIGSDGLTAQTVQTWMRLGGKVMPRACTLKRFTGWATCAGSSTAYIALFKVTPTRNSSSTVSAVLLEEFSYTALANAKMEDWDETSFTETAIAAGDLLVTAIKSASGALQYFTSTVEVEF